MSADDIAEAAGAMIAEHGETATLARTGETSITLKAKRIGGTTEAVGGGTAVQQVFRVKIGTAELLASAWAVKAPTRGDRLTIGGRGRTVRDARPLNEGGTACLYELEVAG